MEDTLERVAQLEKAVKRLTMVAVLALTAVVLLLYHLLRRDVLDETLRVRRLEVIDPVGRAVVVLGTNPFGQPVILVHDSEGHVRFGISLDESGSALAAVFNANDRIVAKLGQ